MKSKRLLSFCLAIIVMAAMIPITSETSYAQEQYTPIATGNFNGRTYAVEIILGIGNNIFAPRAITSEEEARGYATATREQSLLIALRMVENLK